MWQVLKASHSRILPQLPPVPLTSSWWTKKSSQALLCAGLLAPSRREMVNLAYEQLVCEPQAAAPRPATGPSTATHEAVPKHVAVFMHGLMGSGRNLRSFARKLGEAAAAQTHAQWRMVLLDLRCHGHSSRLHGLHPPHNLHAAAQDVKQFIHHELRCTPTVLIGHSLGGKAMLELVQQISHSSSPAAGVTSDAGAAASTFPSGSGVLGLPKQAWVLDSQPGRIGHHDERTGVRRVLQAVQEIPLPIPSRQWLINHLKNDRGFDPSLSNWLGSNVVGDANGRLGWAFNLPGVAALYFDYTMSEYWDLLRRPPPGLALHMVVGGASDRWTPPMLQHLDEIHQQHQHQQARPEAAAHQAMGSFQLHMLPGAGHNIHIDDPDGLLRIMLPHVVKAAANPVTAGTA